MTPARPLPLVVANWKMNLVEAEAVAAADRIALGARTVEPHVRLAVAPSFVALRAVGARLTGTAVALAAQTVHWEARGAFTGEISAPMLADAGVQFVLVGHSERRHLFGETDEQVGRKAAACARAALVPVVCVGETERERDTGATREVVSRQITIALSSCPVNAEIVVAYEPVWAIGTGRNATPDQVAEVHTLLRERLLEGRGDAAPRVPILYGGSVTPESAPGLLRLAVVDGALVGGASLDPERFLAIARCAA